jgi:hypothetical protein
MDNVKPIKKAQDTSGKVLAKTVQLGIGVDLLGSMMSLSSSRGNELEVTPLGVKATSKKNGRVVLIPWANIRGVELL